MQPDHREREGATPPADDRAPRIIQVRCLGTHVGGRRPPRDDGTRPSPRLRCELGRLGPNHRDRHPVDQRQLLAHHPGERAEALDVSEACVGDHRNRRLDDRPELGDLARHAGPRLNDQRLRVSRRVEDRERHADEIVEVAGRSVHPPPRGQRGADHLLGARLAARAGDRHHRGAGRQRPSPRAGQQPQRGERVVHFEERQPPPRRPRRAAAHDRGRRPTGLSVLQEVVGIEAVAFQGDE